MEIYCKMHSCEGQKILACCEKNLLGKTLEENGLCFEAKEHFFGKTETTEKELEVMLDECTSANLAGKKPVSVAQKKGFISGENIRYIKKVPLVQIYKLQ